MEFIGLKIIILIIKWEINPNIPVLGGLTGCDFTSSGGHALDYFASYPGLNACPARLGYPAF
jgi:hypothetical protein